jgi:hypothetical protein
MTAVFDRYPQAARDYCISIALAADVLRMGPPNGALKRAVRKYIVICPMLSTAVQVMPVKWA